MKKRNKLLMKLGILCTAFVGLITALVVPTHAYTLSNNNVYSDNGLNLGNYSGLTFPNYYNDEESFSQGGLVIVPSSGNLDDSDRTRFKFQFFNGSVFVREIVTYTREQVNVNNEAYFQCYDLFTGYTLSELLSAYSDYRVRFVRDEVAPSNVGNDYIEYRLGEIFNYYSMFISSNTTIPHFGICFSVSTINISVPGSIILSKVGAYCGSQVIRSDYVPYGVYGNIDESYINTYSYNQGVLSQQSTITDLQNQIDNMDKQIANLSSQLSLAQSTQMRTLLWTIGSTPFESFKSIWDVNVWGVNIGGIIIGGFMALLIIYLIKKVWK